MKRQKTRIGDTYKIVVVSFPEELNDARLPVELRYVQEESPDLFDRLLELLSGGKAIGVRTVLKTPKEVLAAVNEVSVRSQHRMVLTWLPKLLWDQNEPIITQYDREAAMRDSVDLDECVATILSHRFAFKKFVLIDETNAGISSEERGLIRQMNETIFPLMIHYICERIIADNAHERTQVAQAIIKALAFVGPLAHFAEHFFKGLGKVIAGSADGVLAEAAELYALRGSGFQWREMWNRFFPLIAVFGLSVWAGFEVEPLIVSGELFKAGILFGFSAVALSLGTAVLSVKLYHSSIDKLEADGKHQTTKWGRWKMAILQDFTNPTRLGLLIGSLVSPVLAGIVFIFIPSWLHNGWVLAVLGSAETFIAALTVVLAMRIGDWRLASQLESAIRALKAGKQWRPSARVSN